MVERVQTEVSNRDVKKEEKEVRKQNYEERAAEAHREMARRPQSTQPTQFGSLMQPNSMPQQIPPPQGFGQVPGMGLGGPVLPLPVYGEFLLYF